MSRAFRTAVLAKREGILGLAVLRTSLALRAFVARNMAPAYPSAKADCSSSLVLLDYSGAADFGFVRVLAELAFGPALAEQVPVLVEGNVDGFQPGLFIVAEGALFVEMVLLVGEVLDVLDYGLIGGHGIFSFALRKDN
jgi:hypothetical protein